MPKGYRSYVLLVFIFFFALVIRLLLLGQIPSGFTPDEAAQGYSAYSILKTGRDEWGIAYPLSAFKSFLDYKAPLLTYLMVPSLALFGLNEFAVRLPGAILGALAVIPLFFLANYLFPKLSPRIGILAALLLAVSPWHFQFSRMALEANLLSLITPLSLYFLIKSLRDPRYLLPSAVVVVLGLYSYHAAKLFLPLLLLGFLFLYFRRCFSTIGTPSGKKFLIGSLLLAALLLSPQLLDLFAGANQSRSELALTNFSQKDISDLSSLQFYSPLARSYSVLPRIFHNKLAYVTDSFITNYLGYFSLDYWFVKGGWEITYSLLPDRGLLYLWQLPFLLIGLGYLIKNWSSSSSKLLFLWLFLAPLPAALTKEGYRPNRASPFLGLMELLIALGLVVFLARFKRYRYPLAVTLTAIALIFSLSYANDYFFASSIRYPKAMNNGWRQVYEYILPLESKYDRILIKRGDQSHIFTAFYKQISPQKFQQATSVWQQQIENQSDITYLDQLGEYYLDKYVYKNLSWPEDIHPGWLYLIKDPVIETLPATRTTLYTLYTPTHQPMFEVFTFDK